MRNNINILTEDNFLLFAAKMYDNAQCFSTIEFNEDIERFRYIKRLLNKYKESNNLKERLILNHMIILRNVFGKETAKMLFFKMPEYKIEIKTFLVFLNMMPEEINTIFEEGTKIISSDISLDFNIVESLRKIIK